MTLFNIWPEKLYKFSTRKLLPSKKNRYLKNEKSLMPYVVIENESSNIQKMDEINVIASGPSFDLNNLKEFEKPTFLVSFWHPLKISEDESIKHFYEPDDYRYDSKKKNLNSLREFKKDNITYVMSTTKQKFIEEMEISGHNVLRIQNYLEDGNGNLYTRKKAPYISFQNNKTSKGISVLEKIYKPPLSKNIWCPSGSFLPALCGLSQFADKINVYGWDFYLNLSPNKMGYWKLFFNMYKYIPDTSRSKTHFESALINFYYAYQLSKQPNININGYLGQLNKHKRLIDKIERVLFN